MSNITAISMFSSGGIADLALRSAGAKIVMANELLPDRAALYLENFPDTMMLVGDIRELRSKFVDSAKILLDGKRLDVLFATPPCQGMSKNGRGKLLEGIRSGKKPELDKRNQLIHEVIFIGKALRPKIVFIENVPEMSSTIIEDIDGSYCDMLDVLKNRLPDYRLQSKVIEFADYGVPQRRQRLLTALISREIATSASTSFFPLPTHSRSPTLFQKPWVPVQDVISHLPELDAKDKQSASSNIPLHRVPILDREKYFWVSNTPAAKSAFDNQCVNTSCGYQNNPTHSTAKCAKGINRAVKHTPIRCLACGELLPRPWTRQGTDYRLMSGFTSAYKRMRGDLPASALTRNLSYACSDQKLHPSQNRVLSLKEAMIIHTIDQYDYKWSCSVRKISDKTIREIVGESVPPAALEKIFAHIFRLTELNPLDAPHRDAIVPLKKLNVSLVV